MDEDIAFYESRLREALLAGDAAALDALLADDLLFTDQAGRVLTKAMDLAAHRSGLLRIAQLDFSETQTRRMADAAVVVVRVAVAGTYDGAPFSGDFRYTRVWRTGPDGWRIVAGHCCAVPDRQP